MTSEGGEFYANGATFHYFTYGYGFGPGEEFGGSWLPQQTSVQCRAAALHKLADALKAVEYAYPPTASQLFAIIGATATGVRWGATVGGSRGALLGGGVGATVGVYITQSRNARVESKPVANFYKEAAECDKLARQESEDRRRRGPAMSANTNPPQFFVVTKASGTFALYPYTLKWPVLPSGYIYEQHGPNPFDPIRRVNGP